MFIIQLYFNVLKPKLLTLTKISDRNIIVIEYGETALFELGTYELSVSPFSQDNDQIYHYDETQEIKTRKRSNAMIRSC